MTRAWLAMALVCGAGCIVVVDEQYDSSCSGYEECDEYSCWCTSGNDWQDDTCDDSYNRCDDPAPDDGCDDDPSPPPQPLPCLGVQYLDECTEALLAQCAAGAVDSRNTCLDSVNISPAPDCIVGRCDSSGCRLTMCREVMLHPGDPCDELPCSSNRDLTCVEGTCIERIECVDDSVCPEGQVCHLDGICVPAVLGCPLTDMCLADPEGYSADWQDTEPAQTDWQGVDPRYAGSFVGPGVRGRVEVLIDFYDDHIYGEARGVVSRDGGAEAPFDPVILTGSRDGAAIFGQAIPAAGARTADVVIEARLLSASEIQGVATVTSDEGELQIDFRLLRTSPCGCDLSCEETGACATPCEYRCDCPLGEACVDGYCTPEEDPPVTCDDDCDCEYSAGERCVDGVCQLPA